MNAMNPFQVPTCFQNDHERRRRERFKRTFIAVVATGALVLVGLLIEGCMSEHANAAATTTATGGSAPAANPAPVPASTPAPVVTEPAPVAPSNPPPAMSPAPPPVSKADTFSPGHPVTMYVVRAGDSLTRIAKAHGTTVRAIEAANGMSTDHIAAGARLKIPTA